MKSNLKVIAMSEVRTEKERKDGRPSRQFYVATFQDSSNPFSKPAKRTIWQAYNQNTGKNEWLIGSPEAVKALMRSGQSIPASIVTKSVEAYIIPGADGMQNEVKTYTTVVFAHENENTVFKQAGHPIEGTETMASAVIEEEEITKVEVITEEVF